MFPNLNPSNPLPIPTQPNPQTPPQPKPAEPVVLPPAPLGEEDRTLVDHSLGHVEVLAVDPVVMQRLANELRRTAGMFTNPNRVQLADLKYASYRPIPVQGRGDVQIIFVHKTSGKRSEHSPNAMLTNDPQTLCLELSYLAS